MERPRDGFEEIDVCAHSENAPIRQDLTPMLTEQGRHAEFVRRGIGEATCKALGIGWLGTGRSLLRNRIVFQIRGAWMDGETPVPAVFSHIGHSPEAEPEWRFYDAFDPAQELYGQDLLLFDEAAQTQAQETGFVTMLDDPFEVAKAYEAGLRNVVSGIEEDFAPQQAVKLAALAQRLGVSHARLIFARNGKSHARALLAGHALKQAGLTASRLAWDRPVGQTRDRGEITIPSAIQSLGDMTVEQIRWLRQKRLL